ncbi:Phenylalanine/histidine ammonia-lyase, partial [Saitoella complicata NRRL Y-17804]
IYGVNTGFGGSADTRTKDTWGLQASLIRHLNVGALEGGKLDAADVRAAMCIRVSSALHGASAVRWSTVQVMETMLNAGVTPVIPLRGSISASGDLIPLSYIAAALTGKNGSFCDVRGKSDPVPSSDALAALNAGPLTLSPKEGLAIVNG